MILYFRVRVLGLSCAHLFSPFNNYFLSACAVPGTDPPMACNTRSLMQEQVSKEAPIIQCHSHEDRDKCTIGCFSLFLAFSPLLSFFWLFCPLPLPSPISVPWRDLDWGLTGVEMAAEGSAGLVQGRGLGSAGCSRLPGAAPAWTFAEPRTRVQVGPLTICRNTQKL